MARLTRMVVTLSRVEFMDKMAEAKNLPQTSQPALGYFTEVYESIMAADPETQIISIHLTKGLSGTADAARQAALMVEGDITTLDSACGRIPSFGSCEVGCGRRFERSGFG